MKRLLSALLLGFLLTPVLAFAQSYPAKPVRIIVPFPPGNLREVIAAAKAGEGKVTYASVGSASSNYLGKLIRDNGIKVE